MLAARSPDDTRCTPWVRIENGFAPMASTTWPAISAAQRSGRKKARSSETKSSGSSNPGKWPPDGISVHRWMLY
jgi:hypothetical protein